MSVSSDLKHASWSWGNEFVILWLFISFKIRWRSLDELPNACLRPQRGAAKSPELLICRPEGSYPVVAGWEQAQTWWLIFSHSGLALCKPHSRVNRHIDRTVPGEVEYKGKNKTAEHEGKSLIGKFERKEVLQAVWDTSRENKGSERLRQTQQTGTLPGLFQPNVFKCILLITKL